MFNEDELELLFNGLDALEKQANKDAFVEIILGSMITKNQQDRDDFLLKQQVAMEEKMRQQKPLREQIILLKAKMIQLRDSAMIDDLSLEDLS